MTTDSPPGATPPGGKPWSGHGREELADAVRRLIELTVTSNAPPDLLAETAKGAVALADQLEQHVPEPGPEPTARFDNESVHADEAGQLAAAMPFDVVIGTCNPIAPPIVIEFEPPKAIGRVVFGPTHEGAPGLVHGAVLASAFDIILTAANVIAGGPGPTVSLSIRYRRPTLIGQPSVFESWVTEIDERRTHSRGQLVQNGIVTVEAVGEFVNMERARIAVLHRRDDGSAVPATPDPVTDAS
jgi:acyl-coenzyme A thioesterase PaaI-like protein